MPGDLGLRLDPSQPLYQQVVQGITGAIVRGELASGAALPSVRELAQGLCINPNTVQKAYRELERSGLVQPRPGSGVFVHLDEARLGAVRARLAEDIVTDALRALAMFGIEGEAAVELFRARAMTEGGATRGGRGD